MATIVAVRSGNWSNTSHTTGPWPGGSTPTTKPGAGDTVQTGAYIVTIDEDVTVALLNSTSSGYFTVTSAPTLPAVRAITADVLNSGTANGALRISNPTGLVDIAGAITGGSIDSDYGIYNIAGNIGHITGDITGGSGGTSYGVFNSGTIGGITGNITSGDGDSRIGVFNSALTTIGYITGDITGGDGDSNYGVLNFGTIGPITGDITGGSGGSNYGVSNTGTIGHVTGDITGGSIDLSLIHI